MCSASVLSTPCSISNPINTTTATTDLVELTNNSMTASTSSIKKSVGFATEIATIVDHGNATATEEEVVEDATVWYTKEELKVFRDNAKQLSERLRKRQPSLVQEVVTAYETIKNCRPSSSSSSSSNDLVFYKNWSKVGSARRGLERWVLTKEERVARYDEIKASRSVVLNLQCLLQRSGVALQPPSQEMIKTQYHEFSRHAVLLAHVIALADAKAAARYQRQSVSADDDNNENDNDDDNDDDMAARDDDSTSRHSTCSSKALSVRSQCSNKKSPRKQKKACSSTRPSRSTVKAASSNSNRRSSESPLRRLQGIAEHYTSMARPL